MSSATQRFLLANKCLRNKQQMRQGLTHTLMDGWGGGRVFIHPDLYNDFLMAYAHDIRNKVPLFFAERCLAFFRMFLDLDIEHSSKLTDGEIDDLMRVTHACFKRFFPVDVADNHFMSLVSDASPKSICLDYRDLETLVGNPTMLESIVDPTLVDDDSVVAIDSMEVLKHAPWTFTWETKFRLQDGRMFQNVHRVDGRLKHGIHVVFPHIVVGSEQALFMREALVAALTDAFGDKYAHKGWSHVVDNSVYVNSGLRMMYSCKTTPCKVCKINSSDSGCGACYQGRDYRDGRPYKLKFVAINGVRDNAASESMLSNIALSLQKGMIYTTQNALDSTWNKFPGCPSYGDMKPSTGSGPSMPGKERVFKAENSSTRVWNAKTPVTDPHITSIISSHIRTRFGKQYSHLRIVSVVRDVKQYFIKVDGEGSNYCLNLKPARDHRSNRIWFCIDSDGIRVRCFCKNLSTEGRLHGMCKEYRSIPRKLNQKDMAMLFPVTHSATSSLQNILNNPYSYRVQLDRNDRDASDPV